MLPYPEIDPVLVRIGPLAVRWYGFMYLLGFGSAYHLVRARLRRRPWPAFTDHFDTFNLLLVLAVVLGGRLGYVLLYNPGYYLRHPAEILATWQGGMSFHGACACTLAAAAWYLRRHRLSLLRAADLYIPYVPIGLGLGRLGNFINGELYGRVTTVPWGMVFPLGGPLPRHPSQLYEAVLEGPVLYGLLWWWSRRQERAGAPSHGGALALFLVGYGAMRFVVEFFREPDAQLGLLALGLSMGQWLSLAMAGAGCLLAAWLVLAERRCRRQ